MLLERLPIPALLLLFGIYCVIILITFIATSFGAPDYFSSYYETPSITKTSFEFICNGTDPIHFQYRYGKPHLTSLNMEVLFYISLSINGFEFVNTVDSFTYHLEMNMHLYGSNDIHSSFSNDTIIGTTDYSTVHTRTLQCGKIHHEIGGCKSMILFREPTVEYNYYQMQIYFRNLQPLCDKNIIEKRMEIGYAYINSGYNIVDIVMRLFATACTALVAVVFVVVTLMRQTWSAATTEQKWLLAVLFFLGFYNSFVATFF